MNLVTCIHDCLGQLAGEYHCATGFGAINTTMNLIGAILVHLVFQALTTAVFWVFVSKELNFF